MNFPVQKFREIVLQLLYSQDFGSVFDKHFLEMIMTQFKVSKKNSRKCIEKSLQIFEKLSAIDPLITQASTSYEFNRITKIEKNILRLCVFEIIFDETIPEKVSISEGLRLAKKFSSSESSSFVNAILDNIYKQQSLAN